MPVTQADLFLAILALDSYNRGYNPGMTFTGNSDTDGTFIGDAEVIDSFADTQTSFYSAAYSWDGEIVISYRGTTFPGAPDKRDVLYGWSLSLGFGGATQAEEALSFYNSVQFNLAGGVGGQPIVLTGHSLGGGLAGFVSDLTGAPADVFNNIPYGSGVVAAILSHDLAQGMTASPFVFLGYDPISGASYQRLPSSSGAVRQFITDGEVATKLRLTTGILSFAKFVNEGLGLATAAALAEYGLYLDNTPGYSQTLSSNAGSLASATDLHSQALMVLLLYADLKQDTAWASVGPQLYDALFNSNLATHVNFTQTTGTWYSPAAKMMAAIAYSALDSGYMPFGDTGIQSLFNDADTLGQIQTAGQFTGLLSPSAILSNGTKRAAAVTPVGALAEIAVQFAGDQAAVFNTDASLAQGAFEIDGSTLKVDLDPSEWIATFNGPGQSNSKTTAVMGVGDLFNSVLANITGRMSAADPTYSWITSNMAGFSTTLLTTLNRITEVDIALTSGDLSAAGTLPSAQGGKPGGAMLIGRDGQGSITGTTSGNDVIVGGNTVTASNGNDTILAGGNETITVGTGNNTILADSATMNITLTYAGGTIGTSGSSGYGGSGGASTSAGSDLIIGTAAGGGTYTFTDADRAAFTVVWDGAGNNTFNIQTSSSSNIDVVELNMSGVTGANLANLDMQSLQSYVDRTYGISQSDATIVILNPSVTDKITYNGNAPGTPAATLSSFSWQNNDSAGVSNDPGVVFDETGVQASTAVASDFQNPLEYLTAAKRQQYENQAYDSYTWGDYYAFLIGLGLTPEQAARGVQDAMANGVNPLGALAVLSVDGAMQEFALHNTIVYNTWDEDSTSSKSYVLASSKYEYDFGLTQASTRELALVPIVRQFTTFGPTSDPTSPLVQHFAQGGASYLSTTGGELDLINFNPGDFGIGLPQNGTADSSTEKDTEYEVLQGWAQAFTYTVGNHTDILGTSPIQLGAVISNFNQSTPPGQFYDSDFADSSHDRPTLNINNYLIGASASDPTNVTVSFFEANQELLDGQYYGFTILDTAANVSSAIDALNDDSSLTGITLTDSGTPTLTLTIAQAFGDTTALGEITNASYDIAISDTAADVSQNFDALSADQTVTAINLTDAGTPSLSLTAVQALQDSATLAKISNADYTIAVSDAAANVSFLIDELNGDAAVSSITLTDSGTPTLTLTAAQALGDTTALSKITNAAYDVVVQDSAANILTDASALAADANVTGAVVVDTAANVLDNGAALDASALVTSITVVDSVANISGNLSALQADTKVTSMMVVDTAANILANGAVMAATAGVTSTGVSDTAANVSADIDALNGLTALGFVDLTDSGAPALTLTAGQAVGDSSVLAKISNTSYALDVTDTAAAVAANIDALSQVAALSKITLTDTGTPTLTLTAAQTVNDATVIGMITNAPLNVVVSDTAADVVTQLDALNADTALSAITLTDAGTPTLTLTAAQTINDATALGKITNTDAQIVVSDTAADISANFDALSADSSVSSIELTDSGTPTLVLTVAHATDDTALLAKISNASYAIAIVDTAANIVAAANSLAANTHVSLITAMDTVANILANATALAADGSAGQIVLDSAANVSANIDAISEDTAIRVIGLTDSGTPTLELTVAQTIGDAATLARISNTTFAIHIVDTAANVVAAINVLAADGLISAVTLTDSGTPTLSLDVGTFIGDAALLATITNASYQITIADTSAAVAAEFDTLNTSTTISAITLTDSAPVLDLSAAQALGDTNALGLITNANYSIAVTDTVANFLADSAALLADASVSSIALVDSAANVLAAESAIDDNPKVTSITVVDTAANLLADASALSGFWIPTRLDVVDTAANVAANFDALNADFSIAKITLTDADPVLTLTAAQVANDFEARIKITNTSYTIAVVDSAANVSNDLFQLAFTPNVTSITLTDAGTPVIDLYSYALSEDLSVLAKITGPYQVSLIGSADVSVSTFISAQAILDTVAGGFSISDFASSVDAQLDALNADTNLTAIMLLDWPTPALTLTAAQAVNDTQALGKITNSSYTISVVDSAANILANTAAFAANSQITAIVVQDSVANVLSNATAIDADSAVTSIAVADTATNILGNQSALSALTKPVSEEVVDSAANVSAQIDALNGDASLSSIVLTDVTNPALTLSVAQALDDSNALSKISGSYAIAIVDTAANFTSNIDALRFSSNISSITLTDTSSLSLTLDAADTLSDFNVLSKLANASYQVAVVDTAANIQANLDSLSTDANISSITVEGGGTPVITVTAAQAAADAEVLGKLVNATVDVVNTSDISVAEYLSEQAALDSTGAAFSISDSAANVSSDLAVLSADTGLSAITLTDSGIPTLTLNAAQTLQGTVALDAITNPSYSIAVTDTAANVAADFIALSAIPQIGSITLSDSTAPTLSLSMAEWAAGGALLNEITNLGGVAINDTAANIANDFDALNADPHVTSITISDTGFMDLTVAQVLDDTTALGEITNTSYGIAVIDSPDNIAANIDALGAITQIAQLASFSPISLTVAQAMDNRSLLTRGAEVPPNGMLPVPVAIVDSAANVAAAFDILNRDTGIVSITLTDPDTPVLNLTAAQAANDTNALALIAGPYTVNIVPSAPAVSIADFLANQAALDAGGAFAVTDSSANIAQSLDALNADWHVASISSTDNGPLALTAAQAVGDVFALGEMTNSAYTIAVADTAAAISANFDALNADTHVISLTVTDGNPLTLTASQAVADTTALGELANSGYAIAIVDTVPNVIENIDALNADAHLTSVTLSGSGALALSASQALNDTAVLGEITNASYSITVADLAANVSANIDALNTDPHVTAIVLLDLGALTLTAAQALGDTTALGEITGPYGVAIQDTSADVTANLDALNSDPQVTSITLTDGATPTLTVTAVQADADAAVLGKIDNAPYMLSVTGTGGETVNIAHSLQVSNFAYDTANADWQVTGYGFAETLSNVASVVDAAGDRFLLVGGGSDFTSPDAAVSAASDGDTILLTPGSDAGSVSTGGKAITVEDVSAVTSTGTVPPLVTITSPAVATDHASDDLFGADTITGKVVGYGMAVVAGQTVTLTDNGSPMATATVQADGTFSADVTFAYQGANSIVASAADNFGNIGTSAPVVDLLDSIPPTVTITSAAESSDVATQTITGTVVSGGLATVAGANAILVDNGTMLDPNVVVQSDGSFSTTVTLPFQGANSLVVSVIDSYGNFAESPAVVDTLTPPVPTVVITSAAESSNIANQTITGSVSADDMSTVIGQTVTLTDNGAAFGSAVVQADGTFSTNVMLPSVGANAIVASVTDSNGNTGASDPVVDTLGNVPTADFSTIESSSATFGFSGGGWTVTIDGQTQALPDIERVEFADLTYELVDQFGAGVGGYQSVQAAVDAASGGETILIAPGTYTESTIPAPYSSTPGGLFINTPDLTLQGVAADGSFIASAATAESSGPTIVSGNETDFGSNLFIGPNGSGTTLQGLDLQAGPNTTNKLVEFWANNVTIENNFIDTFYGGTDTGAAAIYIDSNGPSITQYLINGNILTEGIYVANGVGTPGDGISSTQVISNNDFAGSFDDTSGDGRYDMVAVQGQIPGVPWQPDPAQVPTIEGNTVDDNSAPFIFRMTEANPALFPSASDVATILAANTDASTSYAYVLNPDGTLHLVDRNDGSGDYKSLYVANDIETLELGLTGPNAVYGGYRDTMDPGDTIMVQSAGPTTDDITVDNLTINATASSSALTLMLGSGVQSITLADYAPGQGANVNVVANNLGDTITANDGNDVLTAGTGGDTLIGGAGYDTYRLGANMGQAVIENLASNGPAAPNGEVDFGPGVTDQGLWFEQVGNDLQIDVMGTSNNVDVRDWFGGNAGAQVQSFVDTTDGLKLDTQVAQLVAAMATYSANNPGFDPTQTSQIPNDPALQQAVAAAWHS